MCVFRVVSGCFARHTLQYAQKLCDRRRLIITRQIKLTTYHYIKPQLLFVEDFSVVLSLVRHVFVPRTHTHTGSIPRSHFANVVVVFVVAFECFRRQILSKQHTNAHTRARRTHSMRRCDLLSSTQWSVLRKSAS